MRPIIIKIAIGIFLLAELTFLIKTYVTPAHISPELGILMVQPDTSILRFKDVDHACGGKNSSWVTGYTTYAGKPLSLEGATYRSVFDARQKLQITFNAQQELEKQAINAISKVRLSESQLSLSSRLKKKNWFLFCGPNGNQHL